MKVSKVVLGNLQTNCYIAVDELSGIGAVVDPAVYNNELEKAIIDSGMTKLAYILLTHGHGDHILGVYDLKQKYPSAQVVIHADDEVCLMSSACALVDDLGGEFHSMHTDKCVHDGDNLWLGSTEITVFDTPGHTPGSVCYLTNSNIMFSGDTLFCRTCGRTDLFRGNHEDMMKSILKLGSTKGDFIVYPGHGPSTTLDAERKTNRFMRKTQWF